MLTFFGAAGCRHVGDSVDFWTARSTIGGILDDRADEYFRMVRERSLVFYVRPQRECMVNDGFRETVAWDEINRIDGMLDFIFTWQRIPCIGISELNMKDRVRTAMAAVRLYKHACEQMPAMTTQTSTGRTTYAHSATNGKVNGHANGAHTGAAAL